MRKLKEVQCELEAIRQEIAALTKKTQVLFHEERAIKLAMSEARRAREALNPPAPKKVLGPIEVGDYVRVTGGRNSRMPWRQVVEVNKNSVTGRQCNRNKNGTVTFGGYMTTNGINKVVELVKGATL